jgi:hypothetical protein
VLVKLVITGRSWLRTFLAKKVLDTSALLPVWREGDFPNERGWLACPNSCPLTLEKKPFSNGLYIVRTLLFSQFPLVISLPAYPVICHLAWTAKT